MAGRGEVGRDLLLLLPAALLLLLQPGGASALGLVPGAVALPGGQEAIAMALATALRLSVKAGFTVSDHISHGEMLSMWCSQGHCRADGHQ